MICRVLTGGLISDHITGTIEIGSWMRQTSEMRKSEKLELTPAEVEAVISYIFQHARGNPTGKAWKVWQKMYDYLDTPPLFEEAERRAATIRAMEAI